MLRQERERRSLPAPSLVVFCDLHISSKMQPAVESLLYQFGDDSADCNEKHQWRCSRLDCIRCYDLLRGYFWLGKARGSYITLDLNLQQKRCDRHTQIPFMCLSETGGIRQYICPLHKCEGHGDLVEGPDEPSTLTASLNETRTRKQIKQREELKIFTAFALSAGIGYSKVESGEEPYPDIRCIVNGGECWFELGEIVDEEFAERTSPNRRCFRGGFEFPLDTPLQRIIEKKCGKTYETNGGPIDLVLYYGKLPADTSAPGHIERYRTHLASLTAQGKFCRVWIFDSWNQKILWKTS